LGLYLFFATPGVDDIFLPKTHIKHFKNHDKPIYDLKNPFQKLKSIQNKKSNQAYNFFFLMNFKGEKTPNMNSLH
jgi:hypothetical protein